MERRNTLVRMATVASVTVAIILIGLKLVAWLRSDAISLQATLIDSVLDAIASGVNFFVVRQALKPADHEHRFGHGKIEALAALLQSAFIAGSALWLMIEAAKRFAKPMVVSETTFGIGVMIISTVLTLGLVVFQKYIIRHTQSTAIKADAAHYMGDILINVSVIIVLSCSHFSWGGLLDPCMGFFISIYICYLAWNISKESIDMLIDRELPEDQRQKIITLIKQHPMTLGYHDLRTRSAGHQRFIQFHLELDGAMSLTEAHTISDEVLILIAKEFSDTEIIIHEDVYVKERIRE